MFLVVTSGIVMLGILIFVHELGHFIFAKLMGVRVEKFSIGFGPRIVGFTRGETEYMIAAIPLGGYVKMTGEGLEREEGEAPLSEGDLRRAFYTQPVYKRFLIVLAGPVFNILFAVLVFYVMLLSGVPSVSGEPVIGELAEDMPAIRAGLMPGDRIAAIDDQPIEQWSQMTDKIHKSAGIELELTVERGTDTFRVNITPERKVLRNQDLRETEYGLIGISPSMITEQFGPVESVWRAVGKTYDISELIVVSVVRLFQREIPADEIGGPILILSMAGKSAERGAYDYFFFMALISINLGLINLMPVPILDGGHILFMGIEAARRKPLSERAMLVAQKVGFALLMLLIVFAMYNDIDKLIAGKLFQ